MIHIHQKNVARTLIYHFRTGCTKIYMKSDHDHSRKESLPTGFSEPTRKSQAYWSEQCPCSCILPLTSAKTTERKRSDLLWSHSLKSATVKVKRLNSALAWWPPVTPLTVESSGAQPPLGHYRVPLTNEVRPEEKDFCLYTHSQTHTHNRLQLCGVQRCN